MRMNKYPLTDTEQGFKDGIIELKFGNTFYSKDDVFNMATYYDSMIILPDFEYINECKEIIYALFNTRYYVSVLGTEKATARESLLFTIKNSSSYYGELMRNRVKQILDNLKQHGSKTTTKTAIDTSSEVIDDQFSDNVLTKESDSGKTAFNADLLSDNYLSRAVRQILDNDERRRQILTSGNADDNYSEVIREIEVDDYIKIENHMKMIIQLWILHIESQILSL